MCNVVITLLHLQRDPPQGCRGARRRRPQAEAPLWLRQGREIPSESRQVALPVLGPDLEPGATPGSLATLLH